MKMVKRSVTPAEWLEIRAARASVAREAEYARKRAREKERETSRLAGPPPKGYAYHCRYCVHGTNISDGVCVGCSF